MKTLNRRLIINIITSILIFAGFYAIPDFSVLFVLLSGVLFFVSAYEGSVKESFVLISFSLILSVVIFSLNGFNGKSLYNGFFTFLLLVLPGTAMGFAVKNKKDFMAVLVSGTISLLLPILIALIRFKFVLKIDFAEDFINKPIAEFITYYKDMISATGIDGIENLLNVMADIQWFIQQTITMIMPSAFILICSFSIYLMFLFGRKIVSKNHGDIMAYPHSNQLKMPRFASTILIILYVMTFFMKTSAFSGAIANILIIFSALYMVCGLSLLDFYLRKRIHWIARILIYATGGILLTVIGVIIPLANVFTILFLAGLFDSSRDFRRLGLSLGGKKDEK